MRAEEWVTQEMAQTRAEPEYELERLLLEVNELLVERMQTLGLRKTDLANRLGVSRAFVTKLLEGNENITLKTLVKVTNALQSRLSVDILPRHIAELRDAGPQATRQLLVSLNSVPKGEDEGDQVAFAA